MEENKNVENVTVDTTPVEPKKDAKADKTSEELLAEMRVEMAKMKRAVDKATSEASNYKKQLREKMSQDELELQAKAEKEAAREEELNLLRRENTVYKLTANFLSLGYADDDAIKAANAQYDGDTEMLFEIQKKNQEAMQKKIKAELLKSMPSSPISNDSEVSMTREEYDKLSMSEKVKFKTEHYDSWKKLAL